MRSHRIFTIVGKMKWNKAQGCAWGKSAAARPDEEQARKIRQLERALDRSALQIENLKIVLGE